MAFYFNEFAETLMVENRPLPVGGGFEVGDVKGMMTCPYYESHVVGCGKFAKHVNACRRAVAEEVRRQFEVCPYNATHHIRTYLMEEHLSICPDKAASAIGVEELSDQFYGNQVSESPTGIDETECTAEASGGDGTKETGEVPAEGTSEAPGKDVIKETGEAPGEDVAEVTGEGPAEDVAEVTGEVPGEDVTEVTTGEVPGEAKEDNGKALGENAEETKEGGYITSEETGVEEVEYPDE